jgi:hypothetical protein
MRLVVFILMLLLAGCAATPPAPVAVAPAPPALPAVTLQAPVFQAEVTIAPPTATNSYLTNATIGCDPITDAVTGVILYYGNRSGSYPFEQFFPVANIFTLSNLDSRLPWYFDARTYDTNSTPIIRHWTNGTKIGSWTNYLTKSIFGNECLALFPNLQTYFAVSNGVAIMTGYGAASATFTIAAGPNPNSLQAVATISGTNDFWTYSEPLVNGQRYFCVVTNNL